VSAISNWTAMTEITEKLLLEKAAPNKTLVEEALSFNASELDIVSDEQLRKYIVVLGQYLITLQYEENTVEAISKAWHRALDSHVQRVIQESAEIPKNIKTLAEKKAWALNNDDTAKALNVEFDIADSKRSIVKNMHKPVEQYINTLKKEIDARENEKRRTGV